MKIIVANWKMNHDFDKSDQWIDSFFNSYAKQVADFKKNIITVVCPPSILIDHLDSEMINDSFQYLEEVMKQENKKIEDYSEEQLHEILFEMRPIILGAQDCHYESKGSFTGDISAEMLKNIGCNYVIAGHSERRAGHNETDELVSKKVSAIAKEGMTPILCVGESKEIRDLKKHTDFVARQVLASIGQDVKFKELIIAYEPIWSIGTGVIPTLEQISEMTKIIKKTIAESEFNSRIEELKVLYGGSVTSDNSGEILGIDGVDGLLVGKASLDAEEFLKICSSSFEY